MQLQRGLQFAPGYKLQEFLGRGQFGQVWRASAPGGTSAAVKFIDLSDGQGEKEYDGIRRVKQIRQANLMPIIAIWLLDGEGRMIEEAPDEAIETIDFSKNNLIDQSGIVSMPQKEASWLVVAMLLGGQSLQHRLKECLAAGQRGIPTKELISLMDESAKGLDYLNSPIHDLGEGPIAIQHCDVKPANIVLIGNSAVVCDFGLARILTRSQATATSASGTPAYMAPEAIEGKPSCTSDQYSLAITYYQLRTGTLPVNEGSLWQVLDSHRQGKLNFDLVPPHEQAVLRKATSMKWENRFESNVDMVDSLREAIRVSGDGVSGAVVVARSASPDMDQSRLTSPIARTGGVSLPGNYSPSAAHDPTATVDSQFLRSRDSSAAVTPAGLFGSPDLLATMQIASSMESTQESLSSAELGNTTSVAASSGSTLGDASHQADWKTRMLSEASKRPQAALVGASGMVLAGVLSAWVLLSGPEKPAIDPINDGDNSGGQKIGGSGVVIDKKNGRGAVSDPSVLMEQALVHLRSNEIESATTSYLQAIALDPSLSEVQPFIWTGHTKPVASIAMATNGKSLVTLGEDSHPILWQLGAVDGKTPTQIELKTNELVEDSAFDVSPDGDRLVTGELGGSVIVWNLNAADPASMFPLEGNDDDVICAVWHPSGDFVVTASQSPKLGIWEIGDATSVNPYGSVSRKHLLDVTGMYDLLAFDKSGDVLVAMSLEGKLEKFNWKALVATLDSPAAPAPVSVIANGDTVRKFKLVKTQDGKTRAIVAGDSQVLSIWSLDSASPEKIESSDQLPGIVESLQVVAVDDGFVVAAGTDDGTLTILRRGTTASTKTLKLQGTPISGLDFTSDGQWLAVTADQGPAVFVHLGDGESTHCTLPINHGGGRSIKLASQGRWLFAGTYQGNVYAWDIERVKLRSLVPVLEANNPLPEATEKPNSYTLRTGSPVAPRG